MDRGTRTLVTLFLVPFVLVFSIALPLAIVTPNPRFRLEVALACVFVFSIFAGALVFRKVSRWDARTSALIATGVAIAIIALIPWVDLQLTQRAGLLGVSGFTMAIAYWAEREVGSSKG